MHTRNSPSTKWLVTLLHSRGKPHRLTVEDVKKLNVVTKKVKEAPVTLTFRPLRIHDDLEQLTVFSDAGFKKEELDGYALRVALYLRHSGHLYDAPGNPSGKDVQCHVILAESRSIKTVCRSTYAAELMSATSATDVLIPLIVTLSELRYGPFGAEKLRRIRDEGWQGRSPVHTHVMIDAKSVYASIEAIVFKPPAEQSLLGHVLWLRETHLKGVIDNVVWTDTRDMYADGLTKDVIKRDALMEDMSGILRLVHKVAACTYRRTFTHAD